MDNVFSKESWEIKKISEKNFDTKELAQKDKYMSVTELRYLKPIFFDEEVRIDIQILGSLEVEINNKKHLINTSKLENKCILVKNGAFICDDDEDTVDLNIPNKLKLKVIENTQINRFTIVQNMKIDNCNPNN